MSRTLVSASCLIIAFGATGHALEPFLLPHKVIHPAPIWESLYPARRLRDEVSAILKSIPGKHLLFVKYESGYCFCEEWVFNGADLSQQRIVYARTTTLVNAQALARSSSGFDVWVIEPDRRPDKLMRLQSEWEWASLQGTTGLQTMTNRTVLRLCEDTQGWRACFLLSYSSQPLLPSRQRTFFQPGARCATPLTATRRCLP